MKMGGGGGGTKEITLTHKIYTEMAVVYIIRCKQRSKQIYLFLNLNLFSYFFSFSVLFSLRTENRANFLHIAIL